MTLNDQILILNSIAEDRAAGQEMYLRFQAYVSDSPITDTRETQIVSDYLSLLQAINTLYLEVCQACADWITKQ